MDDVVTIKGVAQKEITFAGSSGVYFFVRGEFILDFYNGVNNAGVVNVDFSPVRFITYPIFSFSEFSHFENPTMGYNDSGVQINFGYSVLPSGVKPYGVPYENGYQWAADAQQYPVYSNANLITLEPGVLVPVDDLYTDATLHWRFPSPNLNSLLLGRLRYHVFHVFFQGFGTG